MGTERASAGSLCINFLFYLCGILSFDIQWNITICCTESTILQNSTSTKYGDALVYSEFL